MFENTSQKTNVHDNYNDDHDCIVVNFIESLQRNIANIKQNATESKMVGLM